METNIKIYETGDGDYSWFAAETPEQARQAADAFMGSSEAYEDDTFAEVTLEEMESLHFMPDREDYDEDDPTTYVSFREKLDEMITNGDSFPCHFASSFE